MSSGFSGEERPEPALRSGPPATTGQPLAARLVPDKPAGAELWVPPGRIGARSVAEAQSLLARNRGGLIFFFPFRGGPGLLT